MELRQLRYFLRVADTLHFGHTAELEHIAQSVVSAQIARLEQEVGVRLFDRTSRRVEITEAGQAFLPHAKRVVSEAAGGVAAARAAANKSRTLRVGAFATDSLTHVIFSAFRARFPNVRISYVELSMVNQLEHLSSGEVDVVFVWMPVNSDEFTTEALYSDALVAMLPEAHQLARRESVVLADLLDEPFAVPAAGAPEPWRSYWSLEEMRGGKARVGAEVSTMREILEAVSIGDAIDIATKNTSRMFPYPGVRYVPIEDAHPITLTLVWNARDTNPDIARFRDVVLEVIQANITALDGAIAV